MDANGGPAFAAKSQYGSQTGMSLRDYFAGQALVALHGSVRLQDVAQTAYDMADAMLAERNRRE